MLSLKNIVKDYEIGKKNSKNYQVVHALKGVSLDFRKSEFVSILGQSGCGKTTLLNIIGGLDKYTSGDLIINGVSTKEYKDRDWDKYRNHSIGFVFQSYNLIPHQSVLANVELALTLSGVSKEERRRRAREALENVGLKDKLHSYPNQLSGGQMQRVSIARALVNNPDIILADEPTGALDSKTSVQVMETLKQVSKDKLVVMVTHNAELANEYSSRIVKLFDGELVSDSNPYKYESETETNISAKDNDTKMSFKTALTLSIKNLLTKKGRTSLVSFAGSIGIIGIALILSVSNGFQNYIDKVQEDTLSTYPISINSKNNDMTSLLETLNKNNEEIEHELDAIYSNNVVTKLMQTMFQSYKSNDLAQFKEFLDNDEKAQEIISEGNISYKYDVDLNVYKTKDSAKKLPTNIIDAFSFNSSTMGDISLFSMGANTNTWTQMIDNQDLINRQYDVVAGEMPKNERDIVVILNDKNEINDFVLYSLGLISDEQYANVAGNIDAEPIKIAYEDVLNQTYTVLPSAFYYELSGNIVIDHRSDSDFIISKLNSNDAIDLRVCGIIKPKVDSVGTVLKGTIGYSSELVSLIIEKTNNSPVVKRQLENSDINVFSGHSFQDDEKQYTREDLIQYFASLLDPSVTIPSYLTKYDCGEYIYDGLCEYIFNQQVEQFAGNYEAVYDMIISKYAPTDPLFQDKNQCLYLLANKLYDPFIKVSRLEIDSALITYCKEDLDVINGNTSLTKNLRTLGVCDEDVPFQINIYAVDFENKEAIVDLIDNYNKMKLENGEVNSQINYTDYVGLLMSSITLILDIISTVLIVFVSISLVVSSIMIGVITYISVLERIKEIGILRSIGASKRDIKRVFTAESMTMGFLSGVMGIGLTLLILLPGNLVLKLLTDISNLAVLPFMGALILIIISVLMTFIAGLVPSNIASKKDPVVALRSE